jgi:hypothetical protein
MAEREEAERAKQREKRAEYEQYKAEVLQRRGWKPLQR